jgi:serine/threonine protein phosphatase PrpC
VIPEALRFDAASRTHVGHVRRRNEDCHLQGRWLFAVADGLGGHVAGDVASATAIEALREYDRSVRPDQLVPIVGRAITETSAALRRRVQAEPRLGGMGTTLVALLCAADGSAVVGNVGDSRAYLMRDRGSGQSRLLQVSEDHTYQHLVAHAATVPNLPGRLARFLDGRADGRSPDLTPLRLRSGDRILLCSDGLSSYVPRELVRDCIDSPRDAAAVADRLVGLALDHGGRDNVTVIVVDVHAGAPA